MSSLPQGKLKEKGIDEIDFDIIKNRSLSLKFEYPKDFVPGLKPKKSHQKISPILLSTKSTKHVTRFTLDTDAVSADESDEPEKPETIKNEYLFPIMSTMAITECGDRTQFSSMSMAAIFNFYGVLIGSNGVYQNCLLQGHRDPPTS